MKVGLTWDAGAKLVRELGDEVIVDPVLHGSEHDDRPRVVDCDRQGRPRHTERSLTEQIQKDLRVVSLMIWRTMPLARLARRLAPVHRCL